MRSRGRRRASSAVLSGTHSVSMNSFAEGRVGDVLREGTERDLDVARQFDLARSIAPVRQRDPAHFGIVLGRDGDLQARVDVVIAPFEARPSR